MRIGTMIREAVSAAMRRLWPRQKPVSGRAGLDVRSIIVALANSEDYEF
jgi:hypothetical protein